MNFFLNNTSIRNLKLYLKKLTTFLKIRHYNSETLRLLYMYKISNALVLRKKGFNPREKKLTRGRFCTDVV